VQAGRAAQMGVRLVDLDTLLAESDFMSVHLPKTPETVGLIGADQLARAKSSLVLVNAARGGIVDEAALYDALKTGQIAAAAAAYGPAVLHMAVFWWCLAAIPVIGAFNLIVSFTLAFRLALRAHNVGSLQRARISPRMPRAIYFNDDVAVGYCRTGNVLEVDGGRCV
jgi:hypothetical protein